MLWQILTGGDPVTDRRRYVRGGDRCPPAVADLLMQCLDRNPAARPTAGELLLLPASLATYLAAARVSVRHVERQAGMLIAFVQLAK